MLVPLRGKFCYLEDCILWRYFPHDACGKMKVCFTEPFPLWFTVGTARGAGVKSGQEEADGAGQASIFKDKGHSLR